MAIGKQLPEFVTYPVAMAAAVAICLWVLLAPFKVDPVAGCEPGACRPLPERVAAPANIPEPAPEPPPPPAIVPEAQPVDPGPIALFRVPAESDQWVRQVQGALIARGYSVGPAGTDGYDSTLVALEAFQDATGLPVRPGCDPRCWNALGLPAE